MLLRRLLELARGRRREPAQLSAEVRALRRAGVWARDLDPEELRELPRRPELPQARTWMTRRRETR
jgi:hypothetical protein